MKLKDDRYWNPYVAGVALGLLVLVAFVLTSKGIGASGSFARLTAWVTHWVAPDFVEQHGSFKWYFWRGAHPLNYWLIFVTIGTALGGLVSGVFAGRNKTEVQRGPRASVGLRLVLAFGGGALVGIGSRLARGCTSGQGIVGGGLMSVGSGIFLMSVFAGGFALALVVRRQWR